MPINLSAGMLVGNLILGKWGDHLKLDPSTMAGWTAGAKAFWLMPAGVALAVAVLFAALFHDKSADGGDIKH